MSIGPLPCLATGEASLYIMICRTMPRGQQKPPAPGGSLMAANLSGTGGFIVYHARPAGFELSSSQEKQAIRRQPNALHALKMLAFRSNWYHLAQGK